MDPGPREPIPPRRDPLLASLLTAGLLLRLLIAWAPFSYLTYRGPLIDDAFYSLAVARNLARGAGFSADGLHATSGFQPLYTLLLVPLYLLSPADDILPVHLALTLLALCGAGTGWFLFRIVRRIAGRRGALFSLALFTFSPYFLSQGGNGLETGLFGLLLAATLDFYLGTARMRPGLGSLALLGCLLGATFLARVDGALAAAAIGLDLLLLPSPWSGRIRRLLVTGAAAAVPVLPYLLFLRVRFGTWLPESGAATRFISLCYGTLFVRGPEAVSYFPPAHVPWSYYAGSLRQAILALGSEPLLFPFSLLLAPLERAGFPRTTPTLGALLVAGALLGNLLLLRRPSRGAGSDLAGFPRVALFCAALWIPAYAFGALGQWWFPRYFFPLFLFMAIASGPAWIRLGEILAVRPGAGAFRLTAAAAGLPFLLFAFQAPQAFFHHKANRNVSSFLRMIPLLDRTLAPGEPAGAFQSGTLGYLSGRPVVNLDGVVNRDALRALKEKRMAEYIRSEGIGAVVDYPLVLHALLVRRSPPGSAGALGEVRQVGYLTLVRVHPRVPAPGPAGAPP